MHRPTTFDSPWIDFFQRPCPYWTKKQGGFQLFRFLPKELQLTIWKFTAEGHPSQWVEIREEILQSLRHPFPRKLTYETPGILHACLDSRYAGLKVYALAFNNELSHPIYFDFHKDTLHFLNGKLLLAFLARGLNKTFENLERVTRVALGPQNYIRSHDIINMCLGFTGLKEMILVQPYPAPSEAAVAPLFRTSPLINANLAQSLIQYRQLYEPQILSRVRFTQGGSLSWEPPMVTFGMEDQWDWTTRTFREEEDDDEEEAERMDYDML